jgi:hypothetical protein
MKTLLAITALLTIGLTNLAAQQEKGDKEIGIGGQFYFNTAQGSRTGNASFQFSFGYFASGKNYVGFEADPTVTITTNGGKTTTSAGGFFGSNYRRMLGHGQGKVFMFLGAGGGVYTFGSGSNFGTLFPELGFKSYLSQKTSLECSYKMLYEASGLPKGTTFADRIQNQVAISVRHIF